MTETRLVTFLDKDDKTKKTDVYKTDHLTKWNTEGKKWGL